MPPEQFEKNHFHGKNLTPSSEMMVSRDNFSSCRCTRGNHMCCKAEKNSEKIQNCEAHLKIRRKKLPRLSYPSFLLFQPLHKRQASSRKVYLNANSMKYRKYDRRCFHCQAMHPPLRILDHSGKLSSEILRPHRDYSIYRLAKEDV